MSFLGQALSSCLTFCPGDKTGLDHEGFEDVVRPTKPDPIQPCFVAGNVAVTPEIRGCNIRKAGLTRKDSRIQTKA